METTDTDPALAEFFSSMREHDLSIKAPGFPQHKKRIVKLFLMASIGIAASLLIGALLLTKRTPTETLLKDQVIFTLYEDALRGTTYFEVIEASSMDTWEPATQSLLDEL